MLPVNFDEFQIAPTGYTMVAATMKISEYVVVIYNFKTGRANWSISVKKYCFTAKSISWPWEAAIQHQEFIIQNFITLDSISTATTITEYCRIAYASNMFIWTNFMTPYQNFVLPLMLLVNKCLFFLDTDECSASPSVCDYDNGVCMNSVGSYNCLCNPGYELSNDNITCNGKDVMLNKCHM